MADKGTKTPIEPSMIARAIAGFRYAVTGKGPEWFGPGETLKPEAQGQADGRQFDFPFAYNTRQRPREGEAITFDQMRALADNYDLLRLVIETRKDQLAKLKWSVKPKEESDDAVPETLRRCAEVKRFLQRPDRHNDFSTWLRMLVEDMLVIDAATVYPRKTLGGGLYALEPVDGATIKRVLDGTGRTPLPPETAYQQVLKGMAAVDYTREELLYKPRNPRTNKVYGFSPVEQIIMTVNIAIRRQVAQLQYYTEGNVPEALIGVPESWGVEQIKQFQNYWDEMLEGNTAERRHAKFVPGAMKFQPTREPTLKDEYDEWLARVVCFAFSIEPTPFVKQQNRAVAETVREQAMSEGMSPMMGWGASLINDAIFICFGYDDIEFQWDDETAIDPKTKAEIDQIYVDSGVLHPDEVRADLGRPPLTPEQKEGMTPKPAAPFPGAEGDDEQAIDDDEEKVAKSKKKVTTLALIDRDREEVQKARENLEGAVAAFLTEQAGKIAGQVASAGKFEKFDDIQKDDRFLEWADELAREIDFSEWEDDIPKIFREYLAGVAISGGVLALEQVGVADKTISAIVRKAATDWATNRSAELVGMKWVNSKLVPNPNAKWQITESTREMVRRLTSQALRDGMSANELAGLIESGHPFSAARAGMIARTEIAFADIAGSEIGWLESGVVNEKEWLASPDCCDECQSMNGKRAPVDGTFEDGKIVPLHPHCRCDEVPVIDSEN